MKKYLLVVFLATLVFQYGCKEKVITYADSGTTVQLKSGQALIVELSGNPSTGNDWRKIIYDDQVIMEDGKRDYKLDDDKIGSGGVYQYHFKALAPGKTKLFMEYGPKYDNQKEALKIFEIEVVVVG
jgi:inhibitor of cysteine peptidase